MAGSVVVAAAFGVAGEAGGANEVVEAGEDIVVDMGSYLEREVIDRRSAGDQMGPRLGDRECGEIADPHA